MAYMFACSMRENTNAHRNYTDDVPDNIKQWRLNELSESFRESTPQCYDSQVGTIQLALVEGPIRRNPEKELIGKNDRGHRVSFLSIPLINVVEFDREQQIPEVGEYVEVCILKSTRASLFSEALARTTLSAFYSKQRT